MGNCTSGFSSSSPSNNAYYHHSGEDKDQQNVRLSPVLLHHGSLLGMAYRDGLLAVGSDDKTLSVSSLADLMTDTGYRCKLFKGHDKAVNRVAFSQQGTLWSASRDLSIRMWNPLSGKNEVVIEKAHSLNVSAIVCPHSPEMAHTVFSGSRDYTVRGWDVETGKSFAEFQSPRNIVTAMATRRRDARLLFQGSEDLCVRVWDTRSSSQTPAVHISGYVYFPLCLSLQEEEHLLATGCKGFNSVGCGVFLWDVRNTAKPLHELKTHSQDVTNCQFLPLRERLLVSASKDGSVALWDTHTGALLGSHQFPKKWISSMAVRQDAEMGAEHAQIVVGALDGSLSVLDCRPTSSAPLQLCFATESADSGEAGQDQPQ